jgi:hypothetical protein
VFTLAVAAAGHAAAATQGAVGASSSGQMEISLTKPPALQMSGSRDVILPAAGSWNDRQTVCVSGQGVTGYRLSVLQAAAAHAELDGKPLDRSPLIPIHTRALDCRDGGASVLSLAGTSDGHSVMILLVSPE